MTANETSSESSGWSWTKLATIGLGLAVFAVLMAVSAGPGYQAGLWDLGIGLRWLFGYSIWVAGAGALLALAGWVIAHRKNEKGARIQGILGVLIGGILVAYVGAILTARSVPPIHDITTNLDNPPQFVTLSPRDYGEDGMRVPDMGREELAAMTPAQRLRTLQTEAYPDLQPLLLAGLSVADATKKAEEVALAMGWEVAQSDPETGHMEATDTTTWFGFKDDVLVQVREHEAGALVDVRSVSRVGLSDVGKNADRIRKYLATLSGE